MTVLCAACNEEILCDSPAKNKGLKHYHIKCFPNKEFWAMYEKAQKIIKKSEEQDGNLIQKTIGKLKFYLRIIKGMISKN